MDNVHAGLRRSKVTKCHCGRGRRGAFNSVNKKTSRVACCGTCQEKFSTLFILNVDEVTFKSLL